MSYDSASLTTPDIKWLGVRPSDLDRYNIPEQCRLDMTEHDVKTGKELMQVKEEREELNRFFFTVFLCSLNLSPLAVVICTVFFLFLCPNLPVS